MKLPKLNTDCWQWRLFKSVTAPIWFPVVAILFLTVGVIFSCIVGPILGYIQWIRTGEFENPFI